MFKTPFCSRAGVSLTRPDVRTKTVHMKSFTSLLRWLAVLPAAVLAFVLLDFLLRMVPVIFDDVPFLMDCAKGAMVGIGCICVGLYVAPQRPAWLVFSLSLLLTVVGGLSAYGWYLRHDEGWGAQASRAVGLVLIGFCLMSGAKHFAKAFDAEFQK